MASNQWSFFRFKNIKKNIMMIEIKLRELFFKFKKILSLTADPILLNFLAGTEENRKMGSSLYWNDDKKSWIIDYVITKINFFLAHELGHIHLYKKTNCIYFAKQSPVPVNVEIGTYNISIVDSFVNYKLVEYPNIYPYFKKYIDGFLNLKKEALNINTPNLIGHYLNFYCDVNFVLKKEDLGRRKQLRQKKFSILEKMIIQKYNINRNELGNIKSKLHEFDEIKNSNNKFEIIRYIIQLLKTIPFISKKEISKTIRSYYGIKKKDKP